MRLAVVILASLAACSHDKAATTPTVSATWHGPEELAHVSADSPYVFALLDPPSEAVRAKMFGNVDAKVAAALDSAAGIPLDARMSLDPQTRAVLGIMDDMRGKDARRWWENLGFAHNGRWVLYGLSIWPVLRVEVADPAKLRGIAARALAVLPRVAEKKLGALAYWTTSFGDYSLIAAILEREAVLAILPTAALESWLPRVLGTQLPARSLRDVGDVPALLHKYRWLPAMFGFVDTRRLVDALDRRDALGPSKALATPACKRDLDRLAAIMPRFAFGYHELDANGFLASLVAEAPDVAKELEGVRTSLPALPTDPMPMTAMLAAVDVDGALEIARGWMKRVADHPFTCGPLAVLDDGARELAGVLATPMPPEAHGLRGAMVVVDDAAKDPPSGSGYAIVVGDGVVVAVGELMRKVPGLGSLKVAPDGRPFPLPIALLGQPGLRSAHLAMRAGRAALAIGDTSETRVATVLGAPNAAQTPLFQLVMDMHLLMKRFPTLFQDKDSASLMAFSTVTMSFDAKGDMLEFLVGGGWR